MLLKPFTLALVLTIAPSYAPAQQPATRPANLPRNIDFLPNVQYANPDNHPQYLDIYIPKEAKEKLPVIVSIHGGGWTGGDKRNPPILPLVKDGYAIVSINYRLSQVAKFPAQIHDCKAAIRWVRANAESIISTPTRSASGATPPAGIWSRCSEPPRMTRNSKATRET